MDNIDEIRDYIKGLETDLQESRSKNAHLTSATAHSSFNQGDKTNLIEFQLDTAELINRLEHFLRGDYITIDDSGNEVWTQPKDNSLVLFNEYGVNSILIIVGNYLDKNTILSTYNEERINEVLADLGDELSVFIYCNYEKMGMDTEFKKTRYALTVLTLLHSIESSYRRALGGQTREDLNSAKIFTQSDLLGRPGYSPQPTKKKFNLFKPSTW